jgi:hypothetical protein
VNVPKVGHLAKALERKERLALNLFDVVDRVDAETRARMLNGRLDLSKSIDVDLGLVTKSKAVELTCDLLTAALIIDILRSESRREGDEPIRAYIKREQAWIKLPRGAILTLSDGRNGAALNPEVFPPLVKREDLSPLSWKPVILGES